MKKIMSCIALLVVALTAMVSLTSCEDEMIANDLEGTWEGNMYISKIYNGHTYNSTRTEIEFSLSPFKFKTGTGYWVDYYSGAPWDYVANHIDWTVRDGRITIYFREEGTTMYIDNYRLTSNHFSGTILDGDSYVDFSLVHTSSPNWNSYNYWDSDYYYDSYYSKQSTTSIDSRSSVSDTVIVKQPQRFINVPTK